MTDTNKQKETFESYINFLLWDNETNACDLVRYKKIKQLHDEAIQEKDKSIKINHKVIYKLRLKVKELQAEVDKLREKISILIKKIYD